MDEKKINQELEKELQWVKCRQKMLDIIYLKLLQMKKLTLQTKEGNISTEEFEAINTKQNRLVNR